VRSHIETLERHQDVDGGFRRAEAAHFSLAYDGAATTPELEAEIVGYLEQQFPAVERLFDYTPREAILVVIYTERDFREATLSDSDVAGLFDGKVRVPAAGLRHLDAWSRAVLRHELAHAFVAGKSGGGAPRWLHEGLAQVVEERPTDRGIEMDLARSFETSRGNPRWGTDFTYGSALSFTQFLLARHGQHAMNAVLVAIGRGQTADAAFAAVMRDSRRRSRRPAASCRRS
jgi:hypothetical protein